MINSKDRIETEEELRALMGEPSELVKKKVISSLDHNCIEFISKSPFLVISTSNKNGECDVSPRGDHPGFVLALDDGRLVIPERPGNKRMDTLMNIISNPKIGLLFLIPGLGETLRVNGKATLTKNQELLSRMEVKGKRPLVGIEVEVQEAFIHCAKAFKRSGLWEQHTWADKESLPSAAKILLEHSKLPNYTTEEMEKRLQDGYVNRLY